MRIGKREFRAQIKGDLRIEFGEEKLTSYAGLELVRRFLRRLNFFRALREVEKVSDAGGDFSLGKTVLAVLGMLLVGAKRLHHIGFVQGDPMFLRFAGLSRVPSERTLGRALRRMSFRTWPQLDRLALLVAREAVERTAARRWTIDIDGSVITTGQRVERAQHGYNPGHRKNPSYYPILATLAQTNHVIGHQNRSGNVHDSHESEVFLRRTVRCARSELGLRGVLEVRADSAFFKPKFLKMMTRLGVEYSIKVGMWPWLNLRGIIKNIGDQNWAWVDRKAGLQGVFAQLPIHQWGRTERIAIFRKRVERRPVKAWQLDLFHPDDGYWEYSVVATNKSLGLRALWLFHAGHSVQEKVIGELKAGHAFAAVPTLSYRSNTAWQKLNVLAHNIATSFQIATSAERRRPTPKRTQSFRLKSIATLRFEWLVRAARLLRPRGSPVLRLANNAAARDTYELLQRTLADAA